jgi:hypothetical protein
MSIQIRITHFGADCPTCTVGAIVHANNVHRFYPKDRPNGWQACGPRCTHLIYQSEGEYQKAMQQADERVYGGA